MSHAKERSMVVDVSDDEGGIEEIQFFTARNGPDSARGSGSDSDYLSARELVRSDSEYLSARELDGRYSSEFETPRGQDDLDGIEESLRKMPAQYMCIFSRARHNRVEEVADLFQQGAPVDGTDEFGNTVLHTACQVVLLLATLTVPERTQEAC